MPSTPGASIKASLASSRVMPPTDRRAAMRCVSRARAWCRAAPAREPARVVFEAPRPPFAAGGLERTQAPGLAAAVLMVGDRLLPTGVGVDRLGGGSHLQGGEPQDLPVNLHGRLVGTSAEHTHDGDLGGDPQVSGAAPPPGDLASGGLEKAGVANQTGARDVGGGDRHGAVRHKRTFWPNSVVAGNRTRSMVRICPLKYPKPHSMDRP